MSEARHDRLMQELTATTDGFLRVVDGLTPAQWAFRTDEGHWTVGEIAEHTALVIRRIQRLMTTILAENPMPPRDSASRITDDLIVRVMFDRNRRFEAPEAVRPTGRYKNPEDVSNTVVESRTILAEWLSTTELDLRQFGSDHATMGTLDGVQWLLFAAAHTERHTRQIGDAKAAPGYPA